MTHPIILQFSRRHPGPISLLMQDVQVNIVTGKEGVKYLISFNHEAVVAILQSTSWGYVYQYFTLVIVKPKIGLQLIKIFVNKLIIFVQ